MFATMHYLRDNILIFKLFVFTIYLKEKNTTFAIKKYLNFLQIFDVVP